MLRIGKLDRILVLAPHPDDESLGCGGLMLKFARQIDSFCFLSSGISPDAKEKSDIRISEWNEAQNFIGCNNLGIVELYGEKPLLPRIINNFNEYKRVLKTKKYDFIFLPHPKDNHPEHKYITNVLVRRIVMENGYKSNLKIVYYEVWRQNEKTNAFVEINPDAKLKLLSIYKTQWTICNLPKKILGLNCYRGVDAGFKDYVEAFEVVSINEYLLDTSPIVEIIQKKDEILRERLFPNIISNRFDILHKNNYELYDLGSGVVPVFIDGNNAEIGMTLQIYPDEILQQFYKLLFAKHPKLESIDIRNSLSPYGIKKMGNDYYHYPYWYIELPESKEEFDQTLSSKVRYHTKWYPKKIREDFGEFVISHLSLLETTDDIVKLFFKWKKVSHNFDYGMEPKEYLKNYGISDTYVMYIKNDIVAIGFTCSTGNNVYFEQFSFSQEDKYRKYSLGMVLYYGIICDLIKQGKSIFYLSGGWLDYKKRYNGKFQYTYSGKILKKERKKHHHSLWWHLRHLKF